MPQYDTDPGILRDRLYDFAYTNALLYADSDDIAEGLVSIEELRDERERIRSDAGLEFLSIEEPELTRLVDEGLDAAGWPMEDV